MGRRERKREKKPISAFLITAVCVLLIGAAAVACFILKPWSTAKVEFAESQSVFALQQSEFHLETPIKTVKLSVTGDLMVHEWQLDDALKIGGGTSYNFSDNFTDIAPYIADSDLVMGNLETTLPGENYSGYPMFGTPDTFAQALRRAGFTTLTTANNHCMDKWQAGTLRTLDVLDELGFVHFGTYRSQEDRDTITFQEVNGIKIALLSYTYGTNGLPVPETWMVNRLDENLIVQDITAARQQGADFIIVMPHMGTEYAETPGKNEIALIDTMLNAGADAVFASHPHVLQPMEYRDITESDGSTRTGFVIYSLGNAISSQETFPRNGGVILNMQLQKIGSERAKITGVQVTPIWTQFFVAGGGTHFKIRSIYQMLNGSNEAEKATVRTKDVSVLKQLHAYATSTLLGYEVPLEQMQDTYDFPLPAA